MSINNQTSAISRLLVEKKSTGVAYLLWFFFGFHYAYLNKWGLQFLYWFTLGGMGIWCFIDLIHIPFKVENHNSDIERAIRKIESIQS